MPRACAKLQWDREGRGQDVQGTARNASDLVGCCGAAPATPVGQVDPKAQAALRQLGEAIRRKDCPAELKIGEALLRKEAGKLPEGVQAAVYSVLARCAYEGGAKDKAYGYALRATAFPGARETGWELRLYMEIDGKRWDAAVATVEAMARSRPAALNNSPMALYYRLDRELREAGLKALRRRLLTVLAADVYVPTESAGDAQTLRYKYAQLLAAEGDAAGARSQIAALTDPMLLVEAGYDPHMRPLVPATLDLRAAAEAALVRDRTLAEARSDLLDSLLKVALDLRRLGRADEALSLLKAASVRVESGDGFADRDEKLPWYWNSLAKTYLALGRYEDAVAAYSTGAATKESGGANVSQLLNLAGVQLRFRHPEDSLKTLAAFDTPDRQPSPYGLMVLHYIRGCARAETGRRAEAAADLAYAEAHRKDHSVALGFIYLCLDRMDEAAAFFIARRDDPDTRGEMLLGFSDFDPPLHPVPPDHGGRLERLKARRDVQAAIAGAGGLRHIPLQEEF